MQHVKNSFFILLDFLMVCYFQISHFVSKYAAKILFFCDEKHELNSFFINFAPEL